jgi:hypothetical protein
MLFGSANSIVWLFAMLAACFSLYASVVAFYRHAHPPSKVSATSTQGSACLFFIVAESEAKLLGLPSKIQLTAPTPAGMHLPLCSRLSAKLRKQPALLRHQVLRLVRMMRLERLLIFLFLDCAAASPAGASTPIGMYSPMSPMFSSPFRMPQSPRSSQMIAYSPSKLCVASCLHLRVLDRAGRHRFDRTTCSMLI